VKFSITVKPNSKNREVEVLGPNRLLVRVLAPPKENKANQELAETLARYFRVSKSRISILKGSRSKQKIVEIEEPLPG
jgi:uncharacterized protein (TIGR00251 family)